jgi:4-hydroxybenzoate polyprenyltransferase
MSYLPTETGRVSDAPSGNWVYRVLPRVLWPYAQLARWDRPIGWQLLMWPCFWSAALAANAARDAGHAVFAQFVWHLLLFFVGAVAMRGAGCTYNDLIDQEIDMQVARTRSRPLPSGRVSRSQAKVFLALQALAGLAVLICFNWFSIGLGILSLAIVAVYPFAKRFTDWPQFFLGLAFSWGALMGWAAVFGSLSFAPIALYCAAICWTIGYDTIYAHQDKEDDAIVGVRSTARLFGDSTKLWLALFFTATVFLAAIAFAAAGVGLMGWLGLLAAAAMFGYQLLVLDIRDAGQCLELFKFNNIVGAVIFIGVALSIPFAG